MLLCRVCGGYANHYTGYCTDCGIAVDQLAQRLALGTRLTLEEGREQVRRFVDNVRQEDMTTTKGGGHDKEVHP